MASANTEQRNRVHGQGVKSDGRAYARRMAHRKTLNQKQLDVLRWIADGCPDGVMANLHHRISAASLRGRGLVKTRGKGPTWSAEITDAGREYLKGAAAPDAERPRQPSISVVQQLVDDVVAAGGALRVPIKHYDREGVDYAHRAHLAERHGKVPPGKWLETERISDDELEIRLIDSAEGDTEAARTLLPVEVPDQVGRYHEVARSFRDRKDQHAVSRSQLQRATRLVHVLALESEKRGWVVEAGAGPTAVTITTDEDTFHLHISEDGVRTRGAWEEEVDRYRHVAPGRFFHSDREYPTGPYDANATGRLEIAMSSARSWTYSGRQSRWGDRQSWILEERLPHLFREVEARRVHARRTEEQERIRAEKAAEQARIAAEERERRWHVLMDQARARLLDEHRATQLRAEADRWHEAEKLRRYCDALANAAGRHDVEWIDWARAHADQIDPLSAAIEMPGPPDETIESLDRFMPDGWSAEGPEHGRRPSCVRQR